MMINLYNYSTNDLVFIKFQIFNQDPSRCLLQQKIRSQVLKLSHVDSKLALQDRIKYSKKSLAHGSSLDQV